jgi:hypothetical protein
MMRAEIIYDLSSFYQNFILPRRCSADGAYAKGASERAQRQKMQFAVKFSVDIIYGYKPHYGADGDPFPIGCNALLSHKREVAVASNQY